MRVWALANQKGGCGKTTAAVNLAASLAARGARVCLVDLDPQAHATLGLGQAVRGDEPSTFGVLTGDVPLVDAVRRVRGGFDLCPADLELAEFEERAERLLHPERALAAALADERLTDLETGYDHVLLDCPPRADGVLTANAVRAAHVVLLVVETGAFSLQGALRARALIDELVETSRGIHGWTGPPAWKVLATMYDRRTRIGREMLVALQARFGDELFDTAIRFRARLREAAAFGLPVRELDPGSRAALEFDALADEVLAFEPVPRGELPDESRGEPRGAAPERPADDWPTPEELAAEPLPRTVPGTG